MQMEHIYVFGSNHYGQLGVGHNLSETNHHFLKSLVPIILPLNENIRLIHTKFFTNVILTDPFY